MPLEINPSDILIRVQRQFGDESGVQVTQDDVVRWVNDSLREATLQNPKLRQNTAFVDALAGSQSFLFSLPDEAAVIRINSVYFNNSDGIYIKLGYLTLQEMDAYIDGWYIASDTGAPQVYTYEWAGSSANSVTIKTWPIPDSNVVNGFKINYDKTPAILSTLATVVDVPALYFTYILEYCLMKAYEMDEDWEAADRKAQYIQSTLNTLGNQDIMGQDFYPSVMSLPEDV